MRRFLIDTHAHQDAVDAHTSSMAEYERNMRAYELAKDRRLAAEVSVLEARRNALQALLARRVASTGGGGKAKVKRGGNAVGNGKLQISYESTDENAPTTNSKSAEKSAKSKKTKAAASSQKDAASASASASAAKANAHIPPGLLWQVANPAPVAGQRQIFRGVLSLRDRAHVDGSGIDGKGDVLEPVSVPLLTMRASEMLHKIVTRFVAGESFSADEVGLITHMLLLSIISCLFNQTSTLSLIDFFFFFRYQTGMRSEEEQRKIVAAERASAKAKLRELRGGGVDVLDSYDIDFAGDSHAVNSFSREEKARRVTRNRELRSMKAAFVNKKKHALLDLFDVVKHFVPEKIQRVIQKDIVEFPEVEGAAYADDGDDVEVTSKSTTREYWTERLLEEETANKYPVPLTEQPACIMHNEQPEKFKMRDYQISGLNWLIDMHDKGVCGILADEMGLGKTLQSISFLTYITKVRKLPSPHLVVVPLSVLSSWMQEFARWSPTMRVVRFHGSVRERKRIISDELLTDAFDVMITTYETVVSSENFFKRRFVWNYIVIDEAHRVKNELSLLSLALRKVERFGVVLLTGTPLQNNMHELWALFNFMYPEIFIEPKLFDKGFNLTKNAIDKDLLLNAQLLLKEFMIRRLKKAVALELPPKIETRVLVPLAGEQIAWYKKLLGRWCACDVICFSFALLLIAFFCVAPYCVLLRCSLLRSFCVAPYCVIPEAAG
jgi:hypothetical protein